MSARALPDEALQKLLESFRAAPGNVGHAAKASGVHRDTARRAWEFGFPKRRGWERPMADLVREEQELARARMQELEAEIQVLAANEEARRRATAKMQAANDAAATRVEEGKMIRVAREAAARMLGGLNDLASSMPMLSAKIAESIETFVTQQQTLDLGQIQALLNVYKVLTAGIRQANEAAHAALQMERLLLGEPTAIIGHAHLMDVTQEEAEARIERARKAMERAKAAGRVLRATPQLPEGVTIDVVATVVEPAKVA